MQPVTFLAIYFIVWWLCLFLVLPFGVRNQVESGEIVKGTEPGAPHSPMWWRRLLWTTLLSIPLTLLAIWLVGSPTLQEYWR